MGNAGGMQQVLETVAAAGAAFRGVHYYEGHLSECCAAAGADEAATAAAVAARTAQCVAAYETLADVIVDVNLSSGGGGGGGGVVVPEVITSGTPGFTAALGFNLKAAVDARLEARKAEGRRIPPRLNNDVARNPWCVRACALPQGDRPPPAPRAAFLHARMSFIFSPHAQRDVHFPPILPSFCFFFLRRHEPQSNVLLPVILSSLTRRLTRIAPPLVRVCICVLRARARARVCVCVCDFDENRPCTASAPGRWCFTTGEVSVRTRASAWYPRRC